MELYLLWIFAGCVLLNAFFAGYETGLVSSNLTRVRHLAEKERDAVALRLLRLMEHPHRIIVLVLVGTNLALVLGALAITDLLGTYWAAAVAIPAFLIFGEVLPKSLFRLHPTRLTALLLPVMRVFDLLLLPLVLPLTWVSRGFVALVEAEQRDIRQMLTSQEDVRSLIDESAQHGTIEAEEQEMIHSIMDLQTRTVREVMVPRINIRALPETATRQELLALLKESGHTRIPIYRDNIDEIVGAVSAFSLLTDTTPEQQDITRFLKPLMHVPDAMKLDDLLQKMRADKQPMAVVTDEYGGTDGLVTLEDILEEIFGEFHDEYDKEQKRIRRVGKNAFVIDARMPLEDAVEYMGLDLVDEEVETVAGWVMHLTGRIPGRGEVIEFDAYRITILDGGPNFIASVRLEIREAGEEPL